MPRKSSAALAFSASTAARLRPPDDMSADERRQFVDLVLACRADHFDPVDAPLLARYARALVEEKVAADGLKADGYVAADGKPSPWLPIWQAKMRAVTTLSRMLKLNPAGRQSTPSSEPEPISAYERLALEAQADGRN